MVDEINSRYNCRVYSADGTKPVIHIPEMRYAQAYVPFQQFGTTFTPEKALMHGTVFPELFMPYNNKGVMTNG